MYISRFRILGYLKAGLQSPSLALLMFKNDKEAVVRTQIQKLTHVSERFLQQVREEIPGDEFLQYMEMMRRGIYVSCGGGPTLYALVRLIRPSIVVETGVAEGVSSAYILRALQHNARGHLYSIDLGSSQYLRPGKRTGWIVPKELRDRWTLLLGDAKALLPDLVDDLGGGLEMFLHDSDHSYDHMMWEFTVAWRRLATGGLLLADDIWMNWSFFDFGKAVEQTPVPLFSTRMGGLKKS